MVISVIAEFYLHPIVFGQHIAPSLFLCGHLLGMMSLRSLAAKEEQVKR